MPETGTDSGLAGRCWIIHGVATASREDGLGRGSREQWRVGTGGMQLNGDPQQNGDLIGVRVCVLTQQVGRPVGEATRWGPREPGSMWTLG